MWLRLETALQCCKPTAGEEKRYGRGNLPFPVINEREETKE